jgi:hypothetical protein
VTGVDGGVDLHPGEDAVAAGLDDAGGLGGHGVASGAEVVGELVDLGEVDADEAHDEVSSQSSRVARSTRENRREPRSMCATCSVRPASVGSGSTASTVMTMSTVMVLGAAYGSVTS